MPIAISPKHTAEEFAEGWDLDDKVEVFIARVRGWQLDVIREMEEKEISNREVAILVLLIGFFEMIAKYYDGYLGRGESKHYFKKGLQLVFPDISSREQAFMESLYSDVRCGLFHVCRPGSNVIIQDSAPGSIGFNDEHGMIMISPSNLFRDISMFFEEFSKALRDPQNIKLRQNFERRFDHDNRRNLPSGQPFSGANRGGGAI